MGDSVIRFGLYSQLHLAVLRSALQGLADLQKRRVISYSKFEAKQKYFDSTESER